MLEDELGKQWRKCCRAIRDLEGQAQHTTPPLVKEISAYLALPTRSETKVDEVERSLALVPNSGKPLNHHRYPATPPPQELKGGDPAVSSYLIFLAISSNTSICRSSYLNRSLG